MNFRKIYNECNQLSENMKPPLSFEEIYFKCNVKPLFEQVLREEHLREMSYFPSNKAVELFFYWFPNITGVQYETYWQNIKNLGDEKSTTSDRKTRQNDIGHQIIPLIPVDVDGRTNISWKQWVLNILQGLYLRNVTIEILMGLKNSFSKIFQTNENEEVKSITEDEIEQ